jgi:hypothetical protein
MFLFLFYALDHFFTFAVSQSVNVIECPEFRKLLRLLRPDVALPHRSKLRELILQAWRMYFQDLKVDLAVSSYYFGILLLTNYSYSERCWSHLIYHGRMVRSESNSFHGAYSALDREKQIGLPRTQSGSHRLSPSSWRP